MPRPRNRAKAAESDAREMTLKVKAFRQWIAATREAAELDDFFKDRRWNARYAAAQAREREKQLAREREQRRERERARQEATARAAPPADDLESLYRAWKSL